MTQYDLDARIAALEIRSMHQDQVVEDLNTTITAQWRIIDHLARQVASLEDRLRESVAPALSEAPPPHY